MMNGIRQIHGGYVKDLITKFFYKNNYLCFQILLHLEGGETLPYQEFNDYAEYKKVFTDLQQAKVSGVAIKFPEKNFKPEYLVSKVA